MMGRRLDESRAESERLQLDCQSTVRDGRRAAAMLWGSEEEISIPDLTELAEGRLKDWLGLAINSFAMWV